MGHERFQVGKVFALARDRDRGVQGKVESKPQMKTWKYKWKQKLIPVSYSSG